MGITDGIFQLVLKYNDEKCILDADNSESNARICIFRSRAFVASRILSARRFKLQPAKRI